MPRSQASAAAASRPFRINRCKIGLTYSCPVDAEDNPIPSKEALLEFLELKGERPDFIIAEERHESGKRHYHAYLKYGSPVNTIDQRYFDFHDVHPNIINPGKGWIGYCTKYPDFITNFYKKCPFKEASLKRTWREAEELLWDQRPEFMFKFATSAENSFRKKLKPADVGVIYYGPWPPLPPEFNWKTHALCIEGEAGVGKTQFAKYLAKHLTDEFCYVKGPVDKAKSHYKGSGTVIFDDITPYEKWSVNDWNSLVDVEQGGDVNLRHHPLTLEPGPRIFLHNGDLELPDHPKIDRRVFKVKYVDLFSYIADPE